MINLNELEDWSNDLKLILFDINLAIRNLKILEHRNSSNFKEEQNEIYTVLWYQQYFILIIQFAKIFSDSDKQKRRIKKLCNKLLNESLGNEIIIQLSKNKNDNLHKSMSDVLNAVHEVLLKIEEHNVLIKHINDLRDKVFAHSDPSITLEYVSLEQLSSLSKLAIEIYDLIFGKLWNQFFNSNITYKFDFHRMIDIINTRSREI